jgi:site-specific recombinase XerD
VVGFGESNFHNFGVVNYRIQYLNRGWVECNAFEMPAAGYCMQAQPLTPGFLMHQWHECLHSYENELIARDLSRISRRAYMSRLNSFIHFLENRDISKQRLLEEGLSMEALRWYADTLNRQGASQASVYSQVRTVSSFLAFSGMQADVEVTCPKQTAPSRDVPALSHEEEARFVAALTQISTRERALALTFLYAGLRPSECAELRISDVMFFSEGHCLIHVPQGKLRSISVDKELAAALECLIKERYACDPDFVFLNKEGKPMSIQGMDYLIRRIGQRIRLMVSPSILRKTFLFRLLGQGQDREVVAFLTGYRTEHVGKINCDPQTVQGDVAAAAPRKVAQEQYLGAMIGFPRPSTAAAQEGPNHLWGS